MSDVAKFLAGTVASPPKQAGACEVVILKVRSTSISGLEFSVWPVDFLDESALAAPLHNALI